MYEMTNHKRKLIFINVLITCIATTMMSTSITTALPSLTSYFNISVSLSQWLVSSYYIFMGIMIPISAFIIDRFPTKKAL